MTNKLIIETEGKDVLAKNLNHLYSKGYNLGDGISGIGTGVLYWLVEGCTVKQVFNERGLLPYNIPVFRLERLPVAKSDSDGSLHNNYNCPERLKHLKELSNDSISNLQRVFYVYFVYVEGELRYIGKGKGKRYKHPTSGISSCRELNRDYFAGKKIEVVKYRQHLDEVEALKVERTQIKKNRKGLYNTV